MPRGFEVCEIMKQGLIQSIALLQLEHLQYVVKDKETDTVEQARTSHKIQPLFCLFEWAMSLSAGLHC